MAALQDRLAATAAAVPPAEDVAPYEEPPFPTAEDERCGLFDWAAIYAGQDPGATWTEPNALRLD